MSASRARGKRREVILRREARGERREGKSTPAARAIDSSRRESAIPVRQQSGDWTRLRFVVVPPALPSRLLPLASRPGLG